MAVAVVAAEVESAPDAVKIRNGWLIDLGAEVLDLNDEVGRLAESYEAWSILPPRFFNDSLHITLATVAGVDVLVSWNFKHIVRFDKVRLFNAANHEERRQAHRHLFAPRGDQLWKRRVRQPSTPCRWCGKSATASTRS